jgi:uncharacterized alkaline shock family protein YloU
VKLAKKSTGISALESDKGKIEVSPKVVARIASDAVLESYGIVGLTNKNVFHDIADLLTVDNASKGVEVTMQPEGAVLDLYVVVQYGTRISEVVNGVISRLRYTLEEKMGIPVASINLHIQGLQFDEGDRK